MPVAKARIFSAAHRRNELRRRIARKLDPKPVREHFNLSLLAGGYCVGVEEDTASSENPVHSCVEGGYIRVAVR